jgi:hypothetical protein
MRALRICLPMFLHWQNFFNAISAPSKNFSGKYFCFFKFRRAVHEPARKRFSAGPTISPTGNPAAAKLSDRTSPCKNCHHQVR